MGESTVIVEEDLYGDAPAATVAVTLYNYRDYIERCLDSVNAQTIEAVDLVIVDDCSRDDGAEVASKWFKAHRGRFRRCSLLRHVRNCGLAAARNSSFAHARTEYVFVLDADNLLYPRCLEQLAAGLDNSDADFAYSLLEKFGAATGLHNVRAWDPRSLRHGNFIDAMVMLRRNTWERAGGYSTDMPVMGWEDFDLWFKIARLKGWGIQIPEILGRYFVHRDSMLWAVTNHKSDLLWQYLREKHPEAFVSGDA
jgi:glycosyltransferase involved in cell wall biosynthesis